MTLYRLTHTLPRRPFFPPVAAAAQAVGPRAGFPPVNLYENEDGYVLTAEVPGVDPASLDVRVEGEHLTLAGERLNQGPEAAALRHREGSHGAFERTLRLPEDVDVSGITAHCRHGVLTASLPKRAETRPRQIPVEG